MIVHLLESDEGVPLDGNWSLRGVYAHHGAAIDAGPRGARWVQHGDHYRTSGNTPQYRIRTMPALPEPSTYNERRDP